MWKFIQVLYVFFVIGQRHCYKKKGIPFKEIYIGDDKKKMEEMIKKANGLKTVPQIFIDGQHIGGNDKLQALEKKGKLNSLLGI